MVYLSFICVNHAPQCPSLGGATGSNVHFPPRFLFINKISSLNMYIWPMATSILFRCIVHEARDLRKRKHYSHIWICLYVFCCSGLRKIVCRQQTNIINICCLCCENKWVKKKCQVPLRWCHAIKFVKILYRNIFADSLGMVLSLSCDVLCANHNFFLGRKPHAPIWPWNYDDGHSGNRESSNDDHSEDNVSSDYDVMRTSAWCR